MSILTVSQLNRYVAMRFQADPKLRLVLIRGEISNFKCNFSSGHCYFSVCDAESTVHAVMFRSYASRLKFTPENGMHVILQASVTVYEPSGVYQLNVTDLQPDGLGAQALALQQRREKLAKLGYFDAERKRPIPPMPKKIGIVTSASGAAKHDMLQILERRYPLAEVCVYPCLVQGDSAPQSIAEALTIAGNDGCDVILMGRGGGASEDLSAFQEEIVAHAIYCSPVPVISAVGHETDHCIADAVADLRAPTPSAAAELAVPDIRVLAQTLALRKKQLDGAFFALFDQKQQKLSRLMNRLQMQAVDRRVEIQQERFLSLNRRFRAAMERTLTAKQQDWQMLCARLETVSPIAILQRGYSLVYDPEGKLIRSSGDLRPEDRLEIRFAEGSCTAVVKTVELQEESSDEI